MKKLTWIILFVILFSILGCSSVANQNSSSSSNSKSIPQENHDAFQRPVQTISAQLENGRPWAPLEITDDGLIYGFTSASSMGPSQILCYYLKTGKIKIIYTAENNFQINDLKDNGNYLLWSESVSPNPVSEIKVVLFDKKSNKVKILNDAQKKQNVLMNQIALGNTFTLWSEDISEKDNEKREILQYDLKSGKRNTWKTAATRPVIGNHFIAWIGPETDTSANGAVFVENLTDHSVKKITDGEAPSELAAFGDNLVYSGYSNLDYLNPKKKIYESELVLYTNGRKKVIEKSTDHAYGSPQVSASCISWYENPATRVYCFQDNKIHTLQNSYGEALSCKSYVMWTTADASETKEQAIKDGMYTVKISVQSLE